VAAIEDILGLGHLSKYDYFSRPLTDIFSDKPDLSPYQALTPKTDLNEMNPAQGPAARLSRNLDFSAADRVNDQLFNRILWMMMKPGTPEPVALSKAPLHALQSGY
jgi:hypothetical protein